MTLVWGGKIVFLIRFLFKKRNQRGYYSGIGLSHVAYMDDIFLANRTDYGSESNLHSLTESQAKIALSVNSTKCKPITKVA